MYLHKCLKVTCGAEYRSEDPERYFCPKCVEENKKIAKNIDVSLATKVKEPVMSELQHFEANAKIFNDPSTGRNIYFGRA